MAKVLEAHPNFVVLDCEWNQAVPWMKGRISTSELPGEIIEIGAVKLLSQEDAFAPERDNPFRSLIRPVYYKIMNRNVSQVTQRKTSDLERGNSFTNAYNDFRNWCGEDVIFCGWSTSDLPIMKTNLALHKMNTDLHCRFLDVQQLFAVIANEPGRSRSVEYAVDFFRIPKKNIFHGAYHDACYTGEILREILTIIVAETGNLDFIVPYITDPDLETSSAKNTDSFPDWNRCVAALRRESVECPACHSAAEPVIPWFTLGRTAYAYCRCPDHYGVYARARMKKTSQGEIYGSVKIRLDTGVGEGLVREKKEEYDIYGSVGAPSAVVASDDAGEVVASGDVDPSPS